MRRFVLALTLIACSSPTQTPTQTLTQTPTQTQTQTQTQTPTPPQPQTPAFFVVARARAEVARAVSYDPAWFPMSYPGGDIDSSKGVCTDVVIRGYRAAGVDFQKLVHEDVMHAQSVYQPYVKTPDATIDHRRVGPLLTYLRRHAKTLAANSEYAAGDVVVISFNACPSCSPQHIGVVSDKMGPRGIPLFIHNVGPAPREDDTLDAWTHLGHFRVL